MKPKLRCRIDDLSKLAARYNDPIEDTELEGGTLAKCFPFFKNLSENMKLLCKISQKKRHCSVFEVF